MHPHSHSHYQPAVTQPGCGIKVTLHTRGLKELTGQEAITNGVLQSPAHCTRLPLKLSRLSFQAR